MGKKRNISPELQKQNAKALRINLKYMAEVKARNGEPLNARIGKEIRFKKCDNKRVCNERGHGSIT
ncbi:hypothetical protein TW82_20815, partial [Pseudoalteromonas fuliginea]